MNTKPMKAIYPLSADPVHKGHLHSIEVALDMFDEVHVAMGINGGKNYLFTVPERQAFLEKTLSTYLPDTSRVTIGVCDGLMKNYALTNGYTHIIRGVRNAKDFEFENSLAKYHESYGLQTILLPAENNFSSVSSSMVKEIVKCGGFVNDYVHPMVKQSLEQKLGDKYLVAVTGSMGAGKSTVCKNLVEYARTHPNETDGVQFNHIDVDMVVKSLYSGDKPMHKQVREEITKYFGSEMFDANGINRKKAAEVIFNDPAKEKQWADILKKPLMVELEEILHDTKGVVLLDAAYIVEKGMLPLTNYNVMLVQCEEETRYNRILNRDGMHRAQTACKTKIQLSQEDRKKTILQEQQSVNYGRLYEVDSTNEVDYKTLTKSLVEQFKAPSTSQI